MRKRVCVFFQAEGGIRDAEESRGLGDVYKRRDQKGISHQVKIDEKKEVWISAEKNKGIEDLREIINTELFNGIYRGWISLEPSLGNIRAKLFRMGCVDEEKVSDTGKIYTYIHIGQDELKSFIDIEGFALCEDKDIILES